MDLPKIASRIAILLDENAPQTEESEDEENLCVNCWSRKPKEGYDICTTCCDHPRYEEKRVGDKLICQVCGQVQATGLGPYKPRSPQDIEADKAQEAWEKWRGF